MKIFGIPNCDTVKKVRRFFDDNEIIYEFINFKKSPPTSILLKNAKKYLGDWPVNKRGTTFRKIKQEYESRSELEKISVLQENSSAIKRPIVVAMNGEVICVGYDPDFLKSLI